MQPKKYVWFKRGRKITVLMAKVGDRVRTHAEGQNWCGFASYESAAEALEDSRYHYGSHPRKARSLSKRDYQLIESWKAWERR